MHKAADRYAWGIEMTIDFTTVAKRKAVREARLALVLDCVIRALWGGRRVGASAAAEQTSPRTPAPFEPR
jgi:hypothetical protein